MTVCTQADNTIKTGASKPDDLVKLLSALQASLFIWCQRILRNTETVEIVRKAVYKLLTNCEWGVGGDKYTYGR